MEEGRENRRGHVAQVRFERVQRHHLAPLRKQLRHTREVGWRSLGLPSGVAESRGTAHVGAKVVRELWSRDVELPHFALKPALAPASDPIVECNVHEHPACRKHITPCLGVNVRADRAALLRRHFEFCCLLLPRVRRARCARTSHVHLTRRIEPGAASVVPSAHHSARKRCLPTWLWMPCPKAFERCGRCTCRSRNFTSLCRSHQRRLRRQRPLLQHLTPLALALAPRLVRLAELLVVAAESRVVPPRLRIVRLERGEHHRSPAGCPLKRSLPFYGLSELEGTVDLPGYFRKPKVTNHPLFPK